MQHERIKNRTRERERERERSNPQKKSQIFFTGQPRLFLVKKNKVIIFPLHLEASLHNTHTHTHFSERDLSFDFSFFRLKPNKENKVRNVKNLSTYRRTLPKYSFSSSNLGSLFYLDFCFRFPNPCWVSSSSSSSSTLLRTQQHLPWSWGLVQPSITSEEYPLMVDATFSTISMVISSKFLESTSPQFVQLVEALMVSFGMASKLFWAIFFLCLFFFWKLNLTGGSG